MVQGMGFRYCKRQWLFTEYMNATLNNITVNGKMQSIGCTIMHYVVAHKILCKVQMPG